MIKLIFCVKRLPKLSRGEFQRYWRDRHGPLVKRHAATLAVRRYVQSHTLDNPGLDFAAAARGSSGKEFDGVAELWWDSIDSLLAVAATEGGQAAAAELLADEARFIDLPNSPIFFTKEVEVVG